MAQQDFGMMGLAVMGRSLALNIADHGYSVALWNRESSVATRASRNPGGT